jgi:uncharacterized protein with gpF-like domain
MRLGDAVMQKTMANETVDALLAEIKTCEAASRALDGLPHGGRTNADR